MTYHFCRMFYQEIPAILRRTIRLMNLYQENKIKRPISIGIKNYKRQLQKYEKTKPDTTNLLKYNNERH